MLWIESAARFHDIPGIQKGEFVMTDTPQNNQNGWSDRSYKTFNSRKTWVNMPYCFRGPCIHVAL